MSDGYKVIRHLGYSKTSKKMPKGLGWSQGSPSQLGKVSSDQVR